MNELGRVLGSELLKVRTRASFWMLVAALALIGLVAGLFAGLAGRDDLALEENQRALFAFGDIGSFFPLLVGVLLVTNEYWHKTITHTFLATPHRELVLLGKFIAAAVAGLLYTLAATIVTAVVATPFFLARDIEFVIGAAALLENLALVAATMALLAVLGAAFGALVRNQIAGVIVPLVWFLIVEGTVALFWPDGARFFPGNALAAIRPTQEGVEDFVLDPLPGLLVFVAWLGALIAAGTALLVRRDVN